MSQEGVGDDLLEGVGERQIRDADVVGTEAVARLPRLLVHMRANAAHRRRVVSVRQHRAWKGYVQTE